MRLLRFNAKAVYVSGQRLVIADTLSRSPQQGSKGPEEEGEATLLIEDVDQYISSIDTVWSWAASDKRLNQFAEETQKDSVLQAALHYTRVGWPEYASEVDSSLLI